MTDVSKFYTELTRLKNQEKGMNDYEQGKRDCEQGIPHQHKSKAYTQGYSEQYAREQQQ